jgi:hypothetical protein
MSPKMVLAMENMDRRNTNYNLNKNVDFEKNDVFSLGLTLL